MLKNKTHIILTNFGIGIFDIEWLVNRLEIFFLTTFESMKTQTCKDFHWYIFVHREIPKIIYYRLEEALLNSDLNVNIIKVDGYDKVSSHVNIIKSKIKDDILISSRVDDDDIFYCDAVLDIQKKATNFNKDAGLVSLVNGAEYLAADKLALNVRYESIALMLSMITPRRGNGFLSVNEFAHHSIIESLKGRGLDVEYFGLVDEEPLYLYVKHPLSDSFYSGARARIVRSSECYSIDRSKNSKIKLNQASLDKLSDIAREVPNGMPYKYLDKLNSIRNQVKKHNDISDLGDINFRLRKMSNKATRSRHWKKDGKIRVAIIGSCVSRDLFEHIPDLKERFEICFYTARSSVISYVSAPCNDNRVQIHGENFEDVRARYDINKTHWYELRRSMPDIIIVDFIDERLGLISHKGSWISASGPNIKAFERSGINFDILRPWSNDVESIRDWATTQFFEKLFSITDNVIVHKASWAEKMYTENRDTVDVPEKWKVMIDLNNKILNRMFSFSEANFPSLDFIGGCDIKMISGGDHRWDFSPFHYDSSYYKTLSQQLQFRV